MQHDLVHGLGRVQRITLAPIVADRIRENGAALVERG